MKKAFFSLLAFAALSASGRAALVLNEIFSYANGPLTTVSAGLWARFGGGTNQLDVLTGRAHLTQAETEDDARAFGSFTVGTVYYSFVLNASSLPSGTGNGIAHLKDSATGARAIVFVTTAGAAAGRYRVGVANGATTPSGIVAFDLVSGTDYRIVVCYSQPAAGGPPQTVLWINPCSEQDTVRRTMAQDSFNPATLTSFALRQEVAIGVLDIDNLRIGTTFADVASDTTPPTIICPSNIVAKCTSPAGTPVSYTVAATDNCDPAVTLVCIPSSGSLFPLGNTLVTCTATDDAGNVSRCTFTVTVVDTDPPVINCPSNIVAKCTNSAGTRVTYTVTATDNCDSNVTVVCVPPSGSLFPLGVTLVVCTATDDATNQARCTFTVTVRDFDPPTIRCPSNIVVNSTGPNGAQVFYVVTATDDCDPTVTLVCTPPSGSIFPNGVTVVNCTATDDSGNQSRCSFTVTVVRPIEIDRFQESRAQVAILFPDGSEELLDLAGPTEVHVFVGPAGEASDSNGNGRDDVETEMIQLDLLGTSPRLGPVQVRLRSPDRHPFMRSLGKIEEILNPKPGRLDVMPFAPSAEAGDADSFFDIFVEIQVLTPGPGLPPILLHTDRPKRMRTIIRHKPPEPGATYFNPDILDLLNENEQPTGFRLGRTSHTPNPPPPEIDYFPNSQAQITLQVPGRPDETVMLVGPTTVHVAVGPNGQATDSNNNQLDDVKTEIVQLELIGDSSLGPVLVRLRDPTKAPFRRSMGMIEETANTQTGRLDLPPFAPTGSANSFFDVFFEVVVANQILHTEIPKRMQAVIHHKPPEPGGTYENPESIELLTENGQPAGVRIGRSSHVPNPRQEVDVFNYTLATLLIQLPGGANEAVTVSGSSTAVVNVGPAGEASDTDGDGLDQVESELVALDLAGTSALVGPINVRLRSPTKDPFMRSLGEIEETANTVPGRLDLPPFAAGGTANSFFDVYFEIEVVAGPFAGIYHADRPKRMRTVIRHKPPAPGDTYESVDLGQIELLDENNKPTGVLVGHANHTPNPLKERDSFSYSQGKIVLQYPNGQSERIIVAGPTEVLVCIPPNGQAADSDGDGLDDVPTEMISMNLAGSSSLGPVMVTLDPTRCRSLGQIEEKANNTPGTLDLPPFRAAGTANSFFDVCFKIEVAGRVFRPCQGPVRLGSMITHKPPAPGEAYMNLFTEVVDLCDENGNPTGIRITQEMHTPNPEKETDYFSYSQGKINLRHPDGHIERIIVAGPTEVQVCIDPTGLAADTDFDGLDQVPTRMTLLNLMGNSSLGPVTVSLDPNQPSNGGIEEKVNATPGVLDLPPFAAAGSANSFFDVFALIKVGNQVLHPASRLHIESMITHKPPAPGEAYMNLVEQTIDLLNTNNQPTGFQITGEMHTPNIPKETDSFSYSQGKINLRLPNGQIERVIVAGPTEVQVCLNDQDGLAADTDGDGLDQVPTQMTQLMLQGNSSLGPITVMLDPTRPSLGQIEEKVNGTPGVLDLDPFGNKGCANSFFDVWVKILVGGQAFCVTQALHIEAMICHKPPLPGESYMNLVTQNIQLFNCANGQPTGIFITGEMHTPQIPRETDYFSYSQGKINIRHPNGQIERVILAGPTEVQVGLNDQDGLAADTDGDGLDQVPTEMTQLMLQGNSSLGPVMVMLDPNRPSLGEIEEKVNGTPGVLDVAPFGNQGCANSYFLVYARIKVGNFVLCPAQPLRIESMICHKPPLPGEAYMNLVEQQIPLLDCASGQPTGYVLTGEMHTPNIPKETDYFSYSQGKINLRLPNGQTERVIVAGPTEVQVCFNDQDGLAADTDADGLDEVPTQMTQLMLQGNSSLGPITVMLDPTRPSLGQIEEKVNGTPGVLDLDPFGNKGCANSFFDVWVKILVGGQAFCVTQALHIEAMICHKPPLPGESYMNLVTQNIQLFNCANGQPTGIFITGEMHTPQIPRETDYFSYSQGKINIRHPNGQIERVILAGPTEVQVGLNDQDGLAADTDGDGLDQVPTEMTQLMLAGNSSLGPVMVMLDPNRPSLGEIEEKVNGTLGVLDVAPFGNQGCANSYFLVYARIKVGNFVLCPAQPLRIESMICHKPPLPGEAYMNLVEQQIPLLDCASGQPTGYVLRGEMHTPNIPKETDYFSYSQGKIVLRYPNGQTERIIVAGPTEVQVCINDQDGLAADTDGDGLDEVPTEMSLLDLRGVSSQGPVVVSLDPAQCRSLGQIEEKVNGTPGVLDLAPFGNQGAANSFFNVCFKMQVGERVFHTCRPVRISSMITHKPPAPGEAYMNLIDDIVELCDENGNPTGIQIIQEMHTPVLPKEIDFFPSSYAELDVRGPTGQTETIRLTGPSRVQVCIAPDGLAADTDGDGLDQVPTEMTQLDLSGVSTSLGAIQIRLDPNRRSLGEIEEQVNNTMGTLDVPPFTATGRADSFFDVFAEFHVGNQVFHTAEPLHMQAVITHKPPAPGETYVNPFTQPIAILDANGNPTGFVLLREIHTPNPTNCVSIICPPDIAVWSCSNSAVINFSVQATNRCSAVQPTVVCVPASGSLFPTGMTMVVCTASVAGSPPQSCVFKVTVNADTEPPRLFCPSNLVVWTCSPNGVPVNFNVLATDDCDTNVTVTCTRGGSVVQSGSVFPPGTNVVVCTARDDCGKVSTCSFTVAVILDREPPRLVCPSNIVVQTCGEGERVFYNVLATDDCDPSPTLVCNPPSGSFFPVGNTPVHCVATDDCGHTNECRFIVTVGMVLTVRHIPGGLLEICWPTNCPDFKLQCTHDFSKPIQWVPVTNAPFVSNGMFYIRLDTRGPGGGGPQPRFYRLIRYTPQPTFSPTDTLPPPGAYKSMPGDVVPFFNGLKIRWLVARINPPPPPPTNPPCLTCPPLVMTFPAMMEFQYSTDDGRQYENARVSADVTVAVRVQIHPEPKRFFDTEMLSMNISGGGLPAGVMIRESPTLASRGQHCITTVDGGFMIFSFFDLWLEVSADGGVNWSRSLCPAHVDYMPMPAEYGSMTDWLPPTGRYIGTPAVQLAHYANNTLLRRVVFDIVPGGTNPKPPPCLTCPPDMQELNAMVSFEVSMGGGPFMSMSAPGRAMVSVNHVVDAADYTFFDLEILMMDIVGGGLPAGVMIRESPTMPSKGFLSIRDSPSLSQPYFIGSFFDVWTDLSVDGGQSWSPSMDPMHVELQPDP